MSDLANEIIALEKDIIKVERQLDICQTKCESKTEQIYQLAEAAMLASKNMIIDDSYPESFLNALSLAYDITNQVSGREKE